MTQSADQSVSSKSDELTQLINDRRDFHRNPELAYGETRTSEIVASRLSQYGYDVKRGVGRTGVTGLLRGAGGRDHEKTLLYRADMDALPIHEENDVEYRSRHNGAMHACGHDAHVAIALALAGRLSGLKDQINGNIKFAFQPAEERGSGAQAMIDDGVLDDPAVSAAIGLHVWNNLPVGRAGIYPGPMMAACDEFVLTIHGRGGHGAMPEQTVDAVVVGAQVVIALQTIVSRNVSPLDSAVVTVGKFTAGTAFNVIAETASLTGTVRSFDRNTYEALPGMFHRIVRGITESQGASYELSYDRHTPALVNDRAVSEMIAQCAADVIGRNNVIQDRSVPTMGSEDMSYFLDRVPGCYFFLGTRNEARGLVHPHHSPKFDIDESALSTGVEIMTRAVLRYLS
ncbi:MAG TPA: amidohydrolase [Blastocatellia bacterium]